MAQMARRIDTGVGTQVGCNQGADGEEQNSKTISRLSTAVRSYFYAFFKLSKHSQKYEVKQCCAFFWSLTESWLGQTWLEKSLLTRKNI